MLTSGVPVGSSSIFQCLHPRYKGLHPRNLQVHSFCPDYSVHSRAREEEIRGEDTHTHRYTDSQMGHTWAEACALTDTPEHGSGPVRTTLEAISTEDRELDHNGGGHQSLPSARNFKSFHSPPRVWVPQQALVQKGL